MVNADLQDIKRVKCHSAFDFFCKKTHGLAFGVLAKLKDLVRVPRNNKT